PEQAPAVAAERDLFRMLGVNAMAGRTFRADDPPNVVVLGAGFAMRHFNDVRSALGRTITLDAENFTVIGVMPEAFQFPYRAVRAELWIPWDSQPQLRGRRNYRADLVAARLKRG